MSLAIVVALHLSAVGISAMAPVMCLVLEWRGARRNDDAAQVVGRRLARDSLKLLFVAAALGLLALWLLHFQGNVAWFKAVAAIPPRRLWFGLAELLFFAACMWAYAWGWQRMPRWLHRGLAILAATDVLYHFPPLFASIVVISKRPELWGGTLAYREVLAVFSAGETLSRVAHFILAATALTGLWVVWRALRIAWQGIHVEAYQRIARSGARLALGAVLLQIPSGAVLFMIMPESVREMILMGDYLATGALVAALLAVMALLHQLLAIALGEASRKGVILSAASAAAIMLLMVIVSHRLRNLPLTDPPAPAAALAIVEPSCDLVSWEPVK